MKTLVKVNNVINGKQFRGTFEDGIKMNAWVSRMEDKAKLGIGWGSAQRWVHEKDMNELLEERVIEERTVTDSQEYEEIVYERDEYGHAIYDDVEQEVTDKNGNVTTQVVQVPRATGETIHHDAVTHIEYEVMKDYEIEYVDLSAQDALEQALNKHLLRMKYAVEIMAYISYMNEQREFTMEDLIALSEQFKDIISLIQNGAFLTAKALIDNLTPTAPLDEAYQNEIMNKIQEYIDKLA